MCFPASLSFLPHPMKSSRELFVRILKIRQRISNTSISQVKFSHGNSGVYGLTLLESNILLPPPDDDCFKPATALRSLKGGFIYYSE